MTRHLAIEVVAVEVETDIVVEGTEPTTEAEAPLAAVVDTHPMVLESRLLLILPILQTGAIFQLTTPLIPGKKSSRTKETQLRPMPRGKW